MLMKLQHYVVNMYAKVQTSERKLAWVNTIEYDIKSYKVKTTIVNCKEVIKN